MVANVLDIDKRKIYDLVNIFTTFGLIKKITKGVYSWLGIEECQKTL